MPFDATDYHVTELPLIERDPKTITDPKERLMYLRDFLRRLPPERFRIQGWYSKDGTTVGASSKRRLADMVDECGTAACICGWAGALFYPDLHWTAFPKWSALGLSSEESDHLFFPPGYHEGRTRSNIEAANVLDHLIRTGEVDWSKA